MEDKIRDFLKSKEGRVLLVKGGHPNKIKSVYNAIRKEESHLIFRTSTYKQVEYLLSIYFGMSNFSLKKKKVHKIGGTKTLFVNEDNRGNSENVDVNAALYYPVGGRYADGKFKNNLVYSVQNSKTNKHILVSTNDGMVEDWTFGGMVDTTIEIDID